MNRTYPQTQCPPLLSLTKTVSENATMAAQVSLLCVLRYRLAELEEELRVGRARRVGAGEGAAASQADVLVHVARGRGRLGRRRWLRRLRGRFWADQAAEDVHDVVHRRSVGRLPLAAEERQLEHPLDLAEILACGGDVWVDHLHHGVVRGFG